MNGSPESGSSSAGGGRERRQTGSSVGRMQGLTADARARVVSLARPIGLAFLVAAVGGAIAIVASRGNGHSKTATTLTATNTTPVHTTTPTVAVTTAPTTTVRSKAKSKPKPPPAQSKTRSKPTVGTPASAGLAVWPAGRTSYSVVLVSVPAAAGNAAAAQRANDARHAGLKEVGVLDSSRYPSLNPGYYVVFAGVYETPAQASAGIASARAAGFSGAYVRRIGS